MDEQTQRLLNARTPPARREVMRQRWEDLLFLHWAVDPAEVQAVLPPGLCVDLWQGVAHVGIVGFRMRAVRPAGLPALPWLSYFNELNVRVYVRDARGEPGVWFLSLDCDRDPAVRIARGWFGLPYEHASMSYALQDGRRELRCRRRGRDETAVYAWRPAGPAEPAEPGSLEFHLAERYNFFALRKGRLLRGQVHHEPYRLSGVSELAWSQLPAGWDGLSLPARQPDLAHCSAGVNIRAFGLVDVHAQKNH